MIHVLHGYLAAAIIKPDVHAVALCYGPCTFHDPALLFCNTIAPGEHGNGGSCCPVPFSSLQGAAGRARAGSKKPVRAVRQDQPCFVFSLRSSGKPLRAEPVPKVGNLIPCPCHPAEQGSVQPDFRSSCSRGVSTSRSGTTSSAAAEGVGARTSAARSLSVTSTS